MSSNLFPWLTVLTFFLYAPYLSYLDYRYRDIGTHKIWLPLILLNIPVWVAGILTGIYYWNLIAIAIAGAFVWAAGYWLVAIRTHYIPGADFVYLALISLFIIINPVNGLPFWLMFSFYLAAWTLMFFGWIYLDNRIRKGIEGRAAFQMERGIPFLIPISLALITTVVTG